MKRKIILLSGVHGVGKGYFLKNNFLEEERFTILEASKLIARYKKADDAGHKKVQDILNNQQILLLALIDEKNKITNDIILDGHICILNANEEIEAIPESFLIDAEIDGIVLLQDNVENIIKRQAERDGVVLSNELIKGVQEEEIKYCEILLSKYNIPYYIINNTYSYQQFCEIISRM